MKHRQIILSVMQAARLPLNPVNKEVSFMMYVSRRRLLQLGLLTPLAVSPLYKQSSAFAACQDGACSNPSEDTANRPTDTIAAIDNFIWPIADAPNPPHLIGDAFGPRLIGNPGRYDWHEGIDIKAEEGTDIIASTNGFVRISTDCRKGYENCGKMIQIEGYGSNNQKYRINYCHLSERLVERGSIIDQGTLIGKSGCTGATWPHLHLEIRKNDTPQNPYSYIVCPSTGFHKVTIQGTTTNANATLNVTLRVISPRNKLDINRISVSTLSSRSNLLDSMYVDFNEGHNCGPKGSTYQESSERTVTITPENFWYDVDDWIVNFAFSGLSASNATQVKAEARDCSGQIAQNIKII
jgi:hypothetical protein